MPTPFQRRLLSIVQRNPGIRAGRLSELLWPDSIKHRAQYNTGRGSQRGRGIMLCAGSHAGKLIRRGWLTERLTHTPDGRCWPAGYEITREGVKELNG